MKMYLLVFVHTDMLPSTSAVTWVTASAEFLNHAPNFACSKVLETSYLCFDYCIFTYLRECETWDSHKYLTKRIMLLKSSSWLKHGFICALGYTGAFSGPSVQSSVKKLFLLSPHKNTSVYIFALFFKRFQIFDLFSLSDPFCTLQH